MKSRQECLHTSDSKGRSEQSSNPNINFSHSKQIQIRAHYNCNHKIDEVVYSPTVPASSGMPCETVLCQEMLSKKPREGKKNCDGHKTQKNTSHFPLVWLWNQQNVKKLSPKLPTVQTDMGHLISSEFIIWTTRKPEIFDAEPLLSSLQVIY